MKSFKLLVQFFYLNTTISRPVFNLYLLIIDWLSFVFNYTL